MQGATALLREQVQAALGPRYEGVFALEKRVTGDTLPSPVGDIPRGALTEIAGPASSGRTSLLYSLLAAASAGEEYCALLDVNDRFDPASAAEAGVQLSRVLWVRGGGSVEHTLKAADLLAHAGGFGLVAIDLGDMHVQAVRRVPLVAWFRMRHAVENTKTALIVLAQQIHAHSCSALKIQLKRNRSLWRGELPALLFEGLDVAAQCIRNHRAQERQFSALQREFDAAR